MAAKLILETDVIDVTAPPVLLYGQPGSGKTSLSQTGKNPLTLDFDGGAHRSKFRKTVLRFDSWDDVIDVQRNGLRDDAGKIILSPNFGTHDQINLDTVGTLLNFMGASIIAGNAKHGNRTGGLSLQGWGVLKTTFENWLSDLRRLGKQVVMIAHEKEEKDGDQRRLRPDIAGGSYSIVMQSADIVGYVSYRNNQRTVSWEPTDAYFAKNGAQLKSGVIPDFSQTPDYLTQLLAQAKTNLGKTAEASAQVAAAVAEWQSRLTEELKLADLNAMLPKMAERPAARAQVWHLVKSWAEGQGLIFDGKAKVFTLPQQEGAAA